MRKKLESLPAWLLMLIAFVMVALIGYVDYLTGDYSMLIFYAIPVAFVAWTVGRWGAIATGVAAGSARFISDSSSYSGSGIKYWNSLQDMIFLLMLGSLIALVKGLITAEERKRGR